MKKFNLLFLLFLAFNSYSQNENEKGVNGGGLPEPTPECSGVNDPTNPSWQSFPYKVIIPCPQVKVGIGITNPLFNLDVTGSARINSLRARNMSVGSPYYDILPVNGDGVLRVSSTTAIGRNLYLCRRLLGSSITEELFSVTNKGEVKIYNKSTADPINIFSSIGNTKIFSVGDKGEVRIYNKSNAAPLIIYANNGNKILQLENNGLLRARRIKVDTDNWADYVFVNGYKLLSLQEVAAFIKKYGHLPNIPSAKYLKTHGIDINQMLNLQMEKIEELTLYTIEQENKINQLTNKVEKLEQEMAEIKKLLIK